MMFGLIGAVCANDVAAAPATDPRKRRRATGESGWSVAMRSILIHWRLIPAELMAAIAQRRVDRPVTRLPSYFRLAVVDGLRLFFVAFLLLGSALGNCIGEASNGTEPSSSRSNRTAGAIIALSSLSESAGAESNLYAKPSNSFTLSTVSVRGISSIKT